MKKCLCIVLGILLLAAGIAVGCFCCRPPKPAPPAEPEKPSPPDVVLGAGEWTFSFEEDFLMFPTLRGTLVFEEYPDKLTFSYNGEEREIEIADADYKQFFVLEFEQIFLYEQIPEGAQTAAVYAYKRGRKVPHRHGGNRFRTRLLSFIGVEPRRRERFGNGFGRFLDGKLLAYPARQGARA